MNGFAFREERVAAFNTVSEFDDTAPGAAEFGYIRLQPVLT